jgi:serine/threonine protein kinase
MDLDSDGFPVTSLREIKLLTEIEHPNIIKLKEVVVGYKQDRYLFIYIKYLFSIFLVFEYCEVDLVKLIQKLKIQGKYMDLGDIKCLMIQLLKSVNYLHNNFILHRDLKLSNILLNRKGMLKLADFGLARYFSKLIINYIIQVFLCKNIHQK